MREARGKELERLSLLAFADFVYSAVALAATVAAWPGWAALCSFAITFP